VIWQFILTPHAQRQMRRLDTRLRQRITAALGKYSSDSHGDVRKLGGRENEWRLRVGEWRITFGRDDANQTLVVLDISHRRDAY